MHSRAHRFCSLYNMSFGSSRTWSEMFFFRMSYPFALYPPFLSGNAPPTPDEWNRNTQWFEVILSNFYINWYHILGKCVTKQIPIFQSPAGCTFRIFYVAVRSDGEEKKRNWRKKSLCAVYFRWSNVLDSIYNSDLAKILWSNIIFILLLSFWKDVWFLENNIVIIINTGNNNEYWWVTRRARGASCVTVSPTTPYDVSLQPLTLPRWTQARKIGRRTFFRNSYRYEIRKWVSVHHFSPCYDPHNGRVRTWWPDFPFKLSNLMPDFKS